LASLEALRVTPWGATATASACRILCPLTWAISANRKPYGYRPGERKMLERIKAMRAGGTGWTEIADALNAEA